MLTAAAALLVLVTLLFVPGPAQAGPAGAAQTMFGATWVVSLDGETHASACARMGMVRTDVIFKTRNFVGEYSQGLWTPAKFQSIALALGAHCKFPNILFERSARKRSG